MPGINYDELYFSWEEKDANCSNSTKWNFGVKLSDRHDTAFLQPEIETENLALIHSNFVRPQSLWLIIKD